MNPTPYPEVNAVLADYLAALQDEFSGEMLSVYLLGSLSTGSYVPNWSDVNGVVVVQRGDPAQLRARAQIVLQTVLTTHPEWRKRLFSCCIPVDTLKNVSWQNQPDGWGLIDLTDLVENGILVWGEELRDELERPNLEELRAYVIWELVKVIETSSSSISSIDSGPLPLRMPKSTEWHHYHQHPTKVVNWLIYPTRVLLAWDKGRIGSKAEAVNHYIEEYHGPWEPALLEADTVRRTNNPEALTPEALRVFAEQTISLFEWMVKRLLSILFLPDDIPDAARNFRRWLEDAPHMPPARPGRPYDTLVPGSLGKRVSQTDPDQPGKSTDVFIPNRKPWLRK